MEPKVVFVSSTHEDLRDYRDKVKEAIVRLGHKPILLEDTLAKDHPSIQECYEQIKRSDIFIGIYAHRYGGYPKNKKRSYIELEYDYASRYPNYKGENIKMFSYILDPEMEWPEKFIEDNEDKKKRLASFKSKVNGNLTPKFFTSPEDLALRTTWALGNGSESQDEWNEKLGDVKDGEKLITVQYLNGLFLKKVISDRTFFQSIDIISNKFKPSKQDANSFKLRSLISRYLVGEDSENKFYSSLKNLEKSYRNRFYRFRKSLPFVGTLGLLLGILITYFAYSINILGFRSTYLPFSSTPTIDVISWLVNHVKEDINLENIEDPKTKESLIALKFAHELDHDSPEIKELIDEQISILKRMNKMSKVSGSPELLSQNYEVINQFCHIVGYEKACEYANSLQSKLARMTDSLEIMKAFSKLNTSFNIDLHKSNQAILDDYNKLINNPKYLAYIDTTAIIQKIDQLNEQVQKFQMIESQFKSDTLTISEKQELFKDFSKNAIRKSPATTKALSMADSLSNMINQIASVENSGFNTYSAVGSNSKNPIGPAKSRFPLRNGSVNVWVWGRIITKNKSDRITIKWYDGKNLVPGTTSASIPSLQTGYRIYYYKNFDTPGKKEVRFYNRDNHLIARKVFYVDK